MRSAKPCFSWDSCFLQVLDFGSGYAVCCIGLSLGVVKVSYFIQRSSLMLGHRVDACASHVMLGASFGRLCVALDALRIVLDVFCIVCDAWASFDACASCVEPGTPWVTEASSFAVFFFFSLLCSLWFYHFTQVLYLWISLDIT